MGVIIVGISGHSSGTARVFGLLEWEVLGYTMMRQRSSNGQWGMGYIIQRGAALMCLLGWGNIVMGQGISTWDPVKTVCNMAYARGIVLGSKMFVDGGEIMDQQNYLDGTDKPYRNSNMFRWQSECPSILFGCPSLY